MGKTPGLKRNSFLPVWVLTFLLAGIVLLAPQQRRRLVRRELSQARELKQLALQPQVAQAPLHHV